MCAACLAENPSTQYQNIVQAWIGHRSEIVKVNFVLGTGWIDLAGSVV
jgi:hypothetical protein